MLGPWATFGVEFITMKHEVIQSLPGLGAEPTRVIFNKSCGMESVGRQGTSWPTC